MSPYRRHKVYKEHFDKKKFFFSENFSGEKSNLRLICKLCFLAEGSDQNIFLVLLVDRRTIILVIYFLFENSVVFSTVLKMTKCKFDFLADCYKKKKNFFF